VRGRRNGFVGDSSRIIVDGQLCEIHLPRVLAAGRRDTLGRSAYESLKIEFTTRVPANRSDRTAALDKLEGDHMLDRID